eukprot:7391915-Prymnesium_polylepis.2
MLCAKHAFDMSPSWLFRSWQVVGQFKQRLRTPQSWQSVPMVHATALVLMLPSGFGAPSLQTPVTSCTLDVHVFVQTPGDAGGGGEGGGGPNGGGGEGGGGEGGGGEGGGRRGGSER